MLDKRGSLWYHILAQGLALRLSVRTKVPGRKTYPADMEPLR